MSDPFTQKPAYETSGQFADENRLMADGQVRAILDWAADRTDVSVLSLGIGYAHVARGLIEGLGPRLSRLTIIEGAHDLVEEYRPQFDPAKVELVRSFFEDFDTSERYDVLELGFVLEHIEDPAGLLRHFAPMIKEDGAAFISVPNARSLHRLIGHAAGLLPDVYELSAQDHAYGHLRYFDRDALVAVVEDAGLKVGAVGGLLLKPFTTGQLRQLNLSESVQRALVTIARDLPDISNAVLVRAHRG